MNSTENDECVIIDDIVKKSNENPENDTTKRKVRGIYKIINTVNNKYYVGSSKDILGKRRSKHYCTLRHNKHGNEHLQHAWNKYGESNFQYIVIEEVVNDLLLTEQRYLDIAKTEKDKCYNMIFIAGMVEMTPEIRAKISRKVRLKYDTDPDFRRRLSESHKGKKLSAETISKMHTFPKGKDNNNYGIPISVRMKGKQDRTNQTIYTFQHILTDELFIGRQKDLEAKIGHTNRGNISSLVHKRIKTVKGWKLIS